MFSAQSRLKLVLSAAAAFGALAIAQDSAVTHEMLPPPTAAGDPTGLMTGLIDGEEFTLHTFLVEAGEAELTNTAYWEDWRGMGIGITVSVSAHESAGVGLGVWSGAITLDINLSAELGVQQWSELPDVGYFEAISNPYGMTEGTLEVDEVQLVDEETLRLSGRFDGTFTAAVSGDEKHIMAEFWFDYITLSSL